MHVQTCIHKLHAWVHKRFGDAFRHLKNTTHRDAELPGGLGTGLGAGGPFVGVNDVHAHTISVEGVAEHLSTAHDVVQVHSTRPPRLRLRLKRMVGGMENAQRRIDRAHP